MAAFWGGGGEQRSRRMVPSTGPVWVRVEKEVTSTRIAKSPSSTSPDAISASCMARASAAGLADDAKFLALSQRREALLYRPPLWMLSAVGQQPLALLGGALHAGPVLFERQLPPGYGTWPSPHR